MALLETEGLTKDFGGLRAVQDLALRVDEGEIVGLIGPNGSGKTTLFNLITGLHPATAGRIRFDDGRRELVGLHCRTRSGIASILLGTRRSLEERRRAEARAGELLSLFGDRL